MHGQQTIKFGRIFCFVYMEEAHWRDENASRVARIFPTYVRPSRVAHIHRPLDTFLSLSRSVFHINGSVSGHVLVSGLRSTWPTCRCSWRRDAGLWHYIGQQHCLWWAGSVECVSALRGPAVTHITRLWTVRPRSSRRDRRRVEILAVTTVRCVWRRSSAVQGVSLLMKGRLRIKILAQNLRGIIIRFVIHVVFYEMTNVCVCVCVCSGLTQLCLLVEYKVFST